MEEMVLWLSELKPRHRYEFGGKATTLGIIATKLKTTSGFCISAKLYQEVLEAEGLNEEFASWAEEVQEQELAQIEAVSARIEARIMLLQLPEQEVILDYYQQLIAKREGIMVAVRSSATAEDLPSASFAGQLESYLNIADSAGVIEAIKKCWASLWTARAIHYRHKKGIGQRQIGMAVIVQEMVAAQVAGVMFTANPVNNSRKELYIEAVKGLGESLVLGQQNTDRYIIDKQGLVPKSIETLGQEPLLNELSIKLLANDGVKLETLFEEHLDIEWAFARGDIYILQARPITVLEEEEPEPIELDAMTSVQRETMINILERFPEPILPLDGIVVKVYYQSLFNAYRELGFVVPSVDWRGVEVGRFPEHFYPPAIKAGAGRLAKLRAYTDLDVQKEWQANEREFEKYIKLLQKDSLKEFPMELVMEYLEEALNDFQGIALFRYLIYIQFDRQYKQLGDLLTKLFGEAGKQLQEDLVVGNPQATIEVNQALLALAELIKQQPPLLAILVKTEYNDLFDSIAKLPEAEPFLKAYTTFMENYGHREVAQGLGGLAAATWKDQPQVFWSMLRAMVQSPIEQRQLNQELQRRREQAETKLAELTKSGLASKWPLKGKLEKLVANSRQYVVFRENSHFFFTRAMEVFSSLFVEIGRKLQARGWIAHERDVLYFSYAELKTLLNDLYNYRRVSKLELSELVQSRKLKQEHRRKKWDNRDIIVRSDEQGVLKGVPVCSGKVSGPCRIVNEPKDFEKLRPGDILVAKATNPSWTPVFALIGGLVVEYGGAVSHAAIIAREYGIPAVMGVPNVTTVLKDDQVITIDGGQGLIST